ncbi:glycoside hydrolase family 26 protein [Geodermatophilus ruber]|uniref:Glycosyl hydrolase family 26 n=1 Tax=Geodermatophilus ruber TaxID=504800 RepID=A0A1I4LCM9_9ACTN|nr:glycosyl hydrolase [Geodermatophilus ruber]SFL88691.1 Glycosyl hydrolase family 26 [Geodermatophilus ruber]
MKRALAAALVLALAGCAPAEEQAERSTCAPTPAADLVPASGAYLGVNLEWGRQTLAEYAADLGEQPAVAVSFAHFPFAPGEERNLDLAVDQLAAAGGMLLLTLEPHDGLPAVTGPASGDLAERLDGWNRRGVPVIVRFAHEMNGSWYAWGQQPAEYVAAFRRVADAVHAGAPGSAMMWAPNYGGGYPFAGGEHQGDDSALDTDGDGTVTGADDPYAPYWPGEDAVDWVGMSLYHWGSAWPWGENEVPEPGKFVAQLTGTYAGLAGDDRGLPDFYGVYGEQHGKPVAVPETAALYAPGRRGAAELELKQAWWRQVYDPAIAVQLPRLAMVNWFEWDKDEPEIGGRVDWTATTGTIGKAYGADLPGWARWADAVPRCGSPPSP